MTAVVDVLMPRLSDSMEEGTILRWLKQVGDIVAVGDGLVEIGTDKADIVFEADAAGTLVEIGAAEGDTRAIGEPIARLGDPSATPTAPAGTPSLPTRVKASPVARRIAEERGVDLAGIAGSGPNGRITKADLEAALAARPTGVAASVAEAPPATAPPGPPHGDKGHVEVVPLSRVQHDGEPVEHQRMSVTLACDHRILYGTDAAEFLARVRLLLEEPLGVAL